MLRTGLVSVTFRGKTPAEIVAVAKDASLEGIEWGGDVHVPPGDRARAERIGRMTRDAGLTVPSYGSYFYVAEQETSEFEPVLETAVALGAANVRVWAGRQGSSKADSHYHERVRSDARRIAEMAADAGLTLSFEFHNNTVADTAEATLDLLAAVDRVNVHTYWQVQLERSLDGNRDALRSLLPSLSHVHVFHWVGRDRRPLREGRTAWIEYLSLIRATGREHWLLLEFVKDNSVDALLADAAALRELI